MAKNEIFLDKKSGKLVGVVFDSNDLSKTSADMQGEFKTIEGKTKLFLIIDINNKFEIKFK